MALHSQLMTETGGIYRGYRNVVRVFPDDPKDGRIG
jgi:hypothetical protein